MRVKRVEGGRGKYRFEHAGFGLGSKWVDAGQVVEVVGEGIAGMPEVRRDDGFTYYADPQALKGVTDGAGL